LTEFGARRCVGCRSSWPVVAVAAVIVEVVVGVAGHVLRIVALAGIRILGPIACLSLQCQGADRCRWSCRSQEHADLSTSPP